MPLPRGPTARTRCTSRSLAPGRRRRDDLVYSGARARCTTPRPLGTSAAVEAEGSGGEGGHSPDPQTTRSDQPGSVGKLPDGRKPVLRQEVVPRGNRDLCRGGNIACGGPLGQGRELSARRVGKPGGDRGGPMPSTRPGRLEAIPGSRGEDAGQPWLEAFGEPLAVQDVELDDRGGEVLSVEGHRRLFFFCHTEHLHGERPRTVRATATVPPPPPPPPLGNEARGRRGGRRGGHSLKAGDTSHAFSPQCREESTPSDRTNLCGHPRAAGQGLHARRHHRRPPR